MNKICVSYERWRAVNDHRIILITMKKTYYKMKTAYESQIKYYLFKRKQHGLVGVIGILKYPTLQHTAQIIRTDDDIQLIEKREVNSMEIISGEEMPGVIDKPVWKRCSFYDFYYS